jgi:uncharacterized lipoprotein YmbA
MNTPARLACIATIAFLSACTSAPPTHHITLDDGRPPVAKSSITPGIAVVRANVPDRIDRPQLVLRSDGNQVTLSEQYRWAEPLRREIPRLIANDLGELLDSSRVAALLAEDAGFAVDFKLALDFQQLDAFVGQGVDVDVLWRLEHRSGKAIVGRSSFRQPLAGTATDTAALVAAQRQALRQVAAEIAKEIAVYPKR